MSRLYLVCAICDRRQADGLISGAAWGRAELPPDTTIDHPAVKGTMLLTCPTCVSKDPGWAQAALGALGLKRVDAA
ncbi:MAG TPA: hypothetical protein VJ807_03890 [Gaiellaceae bacterium]|nr:hypothetical protein [Gaiellaceae bacterium]